MIKEEKSNNTKHFVSTFLVTAALNEEDMEAELLVADPEYSQALAAIAESTYDD